MTSSWLSGIDPEAIWGLGLRFFFGLRLRVKEIGLRGRHDNRHQGQRL